MTETRRRMIKLVKVSSVFWALSLVSPLHAFSPNSWTCSVHRSNVPPARQAIWPPTAQVKETKLLASTASSTSGSAAVQSQPPSDTNATHLQMVSFYRFRTRSNDDGFSPADLRDAIFESLSQTVPGVRGSLYIAEEGFNGQFAVPIDAMESFSDAFESALNFESSDMNWGDVVPVGIPTFERLIVRTRDAILRDGRNLDLDWDQAGDELSPESWDEELRGSKAPLLIDCRNEYESDQGTFQQAVSLNTTTFAESWDTLQEFSQTVPNKEDPVYIFCTGGIRCVKVGAYLKQSLGFTNVKRLQHGIIGYQKWHDRQDQVEPSLWEGENFLFDKRRFAEGDDSKDEKDRATP